ncbi:MAG: insulinase family protein [Bacteroidota bacterium]|nr:insulinase family protein [Bacteroidota bacterium]
MSHRARTSPSQNLSPTARKAPVSSYKKTTLHNGIRIVSEEISHVKSVTIGVWIDTGSRNENDVTNGISHFLEHMVFKGTQHRSTQAIARSLESVGGYMNAFTSKEHTCFYARVLDAHAGKAVDVLSDLVQYPIFPEKEIEKEKQVVLEEIKNVEDDPDDLIHDVFEENIYAPSALKYPVIGTAKNVSSFTREALLRYVKTHYANNRIVVAAAGNISHDKLVDLVEKYFTLRGLPNGTIRRPHGTHRRREVGTVEISKPIQQAHVCSGTVAFSIHSKHRYPSLVLNTLLGDGMSSRLFQNIREKYGYAYSVYSFLNMLNDTGSFGVYVGTDKKHIAHSLDLVHEELLKLKKKSVSSAELKRTKEQLKGSMLLGLESTSNRMMRLGSGELYFGEFTTLDEITRHIDAVTAEEVSGVAKLLFREEQFSTIIFSPEEIK